MMSSAVACAGRGEAAAARRLFRLPSGGGRGAHKQTVFAASRASRGAFGVAGSPSWFYTEVPTAAFFRLLRTALGEATCADRVVSSVCGLAAGMGIVCLSVSCLDWLEWQHVQEARASKAARTSADGIDAAARNASPPLLDLLANRLIRKNSKLIHEAYTFCDGPPLGAGAFGVVHRAVHNRTGIERAVKCIDKGAVQDSPVLQREVEALKLMDHPHIYRLIEYFETSRHLWLVTELCQGEELCDRLLELPRGMAGPEVASLMRQMLRATLHCHRHSIVHRDIKPENFLVVPGKQGDMLKLIDFGFSVQVGPSAGTRGSPAEAPAEAGTLLYMSPQVLNGESASLADDVWSLGVILHILLTGRFPFSTNDDARFQELCSHGLLESDIEGHLQSLQNTPEARDLAARLLAIDPAERITVEEALQHPFVRGSARTSAAAGERLGAEELHERCERFARTCRLRRLALAVCARLAQGSWADADRVQATFLSLDRGDGSVDPSELRAFLSSAGLRVSAPWLRRVLYDAQVLPEPPGRAMSYTSFAALTFNDAVVSGGERVCQAVFDLLDADHDGAVSAEDLRRRLELTPQESDDMIAEALSDIGASSHQRSSISQHEFLRLMKPRAAPLRAR
uniref:non-specific serine/threonine protein kinase n=1 Tax=Alexandrium monilatum TaxID=311494 RepID=A0A7S4VF91_9DINO